MQKKKKKKNCLNGVFRFSFLNEIMAMDFSIPCSLFRLNQVQGEMCIDGEAVLSLCSVMIRLYRKKELRSLLGYLWLKK
jgi:hypothetical protein